MYKGHKVCCFIGHRNFSEDKVDKNCFTRYLTGLIDGNYKIFLFGSRSKFDNFCYNILRYLKNTFSDIKLVKINAYKEQEFLNIKDRDKYLGILKNNLNTDAHIRYFDYEYISKRANIGHRDTYILRNFDMIDFSDLCVFYYDRDYTVRNRSKSMLHTNNKNSGTSIAYNYAKRAGKDVINLLDTINIIS